MNKKEFENSFYPISSWCLICQEGATRRKTYGGIDRKIFMSKQNEVGQVGVHSRLCKHYYNENFDCRKYSSMNPHFLEQFSWQQSCKSLQKQQI
jgi:hypothetical protein